MLGIVTKQMYPEAAQDARLVNTSYPEAISQTHPHVKTTIVSCTLSVDFLFNY